MSKNICRVCLIKDPKLHSIYDLILNSDGIKITIQEMLSFCSSITIVTNYPKSICSNCLDVCIKAYNFIKLFQKNNAVFETLSKDQCGFQEIPTYIINKEIKIECSNDGDSIMDDPLEISPLLNVNKDENQLPEVAGSSDTKIEVIKPKSRDSEKKHQCPVCNERYRFYTSFTRHIKLHPSEFNCNLCDKICENSDEFQQHYFKDHYNVCNICNVGFALRKHYENHKAVVHKDLVVPNPALRGRICRRKSSNKINENDSFKCPNCTTECNTLNKIVKHFNQTHENEQITCNHCEETFSQPNDYLYHYEYKHLNYCSICDINIDIRTSFIRHKRNHQEKACFLKVKPHKCPLCATQCPNFEDFVSHLKGSHNEPVKCIICDRQVDNVELYIAHYETKHRIKCKRCKVFCITSKQFEDHINKNYSPDSVEKKTVQFVNKYKAEYLNRRRKGYKHTCPICASSIDKLGEFRLHISHSHLDYDSSTPVTCNYCSSTVSSLQEFIQHYQSEHYVKCSQCKVFFTNKYSLQEHDCKPNDKVRVKYAVPDKMCSICGKTFKGSLKGHLESHQNQANYKCDKCNSTFTRYDQLRYHRLKKHNLMKHLCPDCGQMFVNKTHLREHSWIHTGVKAYNCDECGQGFTTSGSLRKHRLKLRCGKRKNYERSSKKEANKPV